MIWSLLDASLFTSSSDWLFFPHRDWWSTSKCITTSIKKTLQLLNIVSISAWNGLSQILHLSRFLCSLYVTCHSPDLILNHKNSSFCCSILNIHETFCITQHLYALSTQNSLDLTYTIKYSVTKDFLSSYIAWHIHYYLQVFTWLNSCRVAWFQRWPFNSTLNHMCLKVPSIA